MLSDKGVNGNSACIPWFLITKYRQAKEPKAPKAPKVPVIEMPEDMGSLGGF